MTDSPTCSPASADGGGRFALAAWIVLSLLGVAALLANAPAPRKLLLFTAFLAWLVEAWRGRRRDWLAVVLPWSAISLGSALWSPLPANSAVDALFEGIFPVTAGLLTMSLLQRLPRRWLALPFALLLLAAVPAVLGGLREHLGLWLAAPPFFIKAYAGRGIASTAGLFLLLMGGTLLALRPTLPARTPLALGLIGSGLALGLLGFNRNFWLALPVGLLPWLYALPALQGRRLIVVLAASAVLATGLYASHAARIAPQAIGDGPAPAAASGFADDPRWQIWQSWGKLAMEKPLLGHGYGARLLPRLGEKLPSTGDEARDSTAQHHAHNVLLNLVVGTGLVGLAAFAWLLIGTWRLIRPQDAATARWRLAALSLLLAALAKSLTDDFFWGPAGILMWLFVGVCAGLAHCRDRETKT